MSDKMISVTTEKEYDMTSGKSESRIFVKMYVAAVHSGLIADMGAENWQTLCVIASFMSEDGSCWPTQAQIASRLNVRRETANRRVKRLAEYRWEDRPVLEVKRERAKGGTWDNARYTILPISQLRIFDAEPDDIVRD